MPTNPKIIYIMGEGRSGSTILDVILANHPSIAGVGELWSFFADTESATGNCSCGAAYTDCQFWATAKDAYLNQLEGRSLSEVRRNQVKHDQWRALLFKLIGIEKADFAIYRNDMRLIYETLSEVSGKSVVVDSTKQVGRALNLLNSPGLDVYLIHLVRDGRGVLWSRLRDKHRVANLQRPLWRRDPIFSILSWTIKNSLALIVGRHAREKYLLVRYEDFVVQPEYVLTQIGNHVGLDMSGLISKVDMDIPFETIHQIGGSRQSRYKSQIRLKPDREWETNLVRWHRLLFWLLAGNLAKKLGYR